MNTAAFQLTKQTKRSNEWIDGATARKTNMFASEVGVSIIGVNSDSINQSWIVNAQAERNKAAKSLLRDFETKFGSTVPGAIAAKAKRITLTEGATAEDLHDLWFLLQVQALKLALAKQELLQLARSLSAKAFPPGVAPQRVAVLVNPGTAEEGYRVVPSSSPEGDPMTAEHVELNGHPTLHINREKGGNAFIVFTKCNNNPADEKLVRALVAAHIEHCTGKFFKERLTAPMRKAATEANSRMQLDA